MNPEIKRRIEQIRRGDVPEEYKKRNIYFLRNHSNKNSKNSKCL